MAPAPVAAFLTTVPKIGGAIALYRFVSLMALDRPQVTALVAGLSALTMTLGNLAALWQSDVRRLLGWSAVSQSGYALMAVAVVGTTDTALSALLYFLLGYAAANALAFGAVIHLRGRTRLEDFAGLAHTRPLTAIALIVGLLSLVGIPPLVGFLGKLELFRAAIAGNLGWLAALAVANTVLSLFYYLRVVAPMVLQKPPDTAQTLGRTTGAGVYLALAAVMMLGLLAGPVAGAFSQGVALPL